MELNREILEKLIQRQMPFGKHKGVKLLDLPVSYLEWFAKEGFPPGALGNELALAYEIKINGLMDLIRPLKNKGRS